MMRLKIGFSHFNACLKRIQQNERAFDNGERKPIISFLFMHFPFFYQVKLAILNYLKSLVSLVESADIPNNKVDKPNNKVDIPNNKVDIPNHKSIIPD